MPDCQRSGIVVTVSFFLYLCGILVLAFALALRIGIGFIFGMGGALFRVVTANDAWTNDICFHWRVYLRAGELNWLDSTEAIGSNTLQLIR